MLPEAPAPVTLNHTLLPLTENVLPGKPAAMVSSSVFADAETMKPLQPLYLKHLIFQYLNNIVLPRVGDTPRHPGRLAGDPDRQRE
jgi:hypothetical protein